MKTKKRIISILITVMMAGFSHVCLSQEMEEVVVTGSRVPVSFADTTRNVTVISKEDIEELRVDSVPEILNFAAGMDIQNRGDFGVQSDVAMRGSTFQQVLVLIDGIRVNDSQTAHHNMDLPLNVEDIERIEILHGHGSSAYGADAFGGVINIITKDADEKEMNVSMGGGQYNSLNGSFNISYKWRNIARRYSASRKISDGFYQGYPKGTGYDLMCLSSVFTFDLNDTRYKIFFGLTDKLFGAYDFYTPGLNYPSKETTRTRFVNFQTSRKVNRVVIEPKIYWKSHSDNYVLDRTGERSDYEAQHITYQYGGELNVRFDNIAAGVEVSEEIIESSTLGDHDRARYAVFTEYAKKFNMNYDLNAGLRFDFYSEWGGNVSPTVGFGWRFTPDWKFIVSGGKAFRTPSYIELYSPLKSVNVGDAALVPEEVISVETGVVYDAGKDFRFGFTVFDRIEYNIIDWVGDSSTGPWRAQNIGEGNMFGVESSVWKKWDSLSVSVKYSWNGSLRTQDYISKYSLRFPQHQLGVMVSSDIFWDMKATLRTNYKMRLDEKGYLLVHLLLTKRIKKVEVFVKADNILNAEYAEITGVPCPGRWIMAGVKLNMDSLLK